MVLRISKYELYISAVILALPSLSILLAAALSIGIDGSRMDARSVASYAGFALCESLVWAVAASRYRLYDLRQIFEDQFGVWFPVQAVGVTVAASGAVLFLTGNEAISRSFFVVALTLLLMFTMTARNGVRMLLWKMRTQTKPVRILLVGTDRFARRVARRLQYMRMFRTLVVGYVRLPDQEVHVSGAHIYSHDELHQIDPTGIDDVIVAIPSGTYPRARHLFTEIQHLCRPVRAVVDLPEMIALGSNAIHVDRMQLLDVCGVPAESAHRLVAKRLFDVVFSFFTIVIISPLIAMIAIAIKLTSPGPVFFRQDRIGLDGTQFKMLKFRSMYLNATSNTTHTAERDPRITPVGAFLRRTSLDELPQFFNVLKGDMSVVGPRPELTFFVYKFRNEIPWYMARHNMKCGMTGLAQVHGLRGSNGTIAKRVQYDLDYIRRWSLGLDLKIIWQTIATGFSGKNAF